MGLVRVANVMAGAHGGWRWLVHAGEERARTANGLPGGDAAGCSSFSPTDWGCAGSILVSLVLTGLVLWLMHGGGGMVVR